MKRLITIMFMLAATALLGTQMHAAQVDADAALNCARSFMATQTSGRLMSAGATMRLAHAEPSSQEDGQVDYYVFNTSDDAAFVIVAGDDRVKPILGYGNGALDVEQLPCNVRWWLDGYKRQIEWVRDQSESPSAESIKRAAADEDFTVEPMLTCQWSQGEPYDWQCAVYEGQYCLTGCVATAMAQVMHYWKYPDELPELPAYTSEGLLIYHEALPSVKVDWENMLDSYIGSYTNEQGAAVATLMRYCSQACYTDCSPDGSASSQIDQLFAFKEFGYNRQAFFLARDNCDLDSEEWHELVNDELLAGRPIPYGGSDGSGGHSFVIDGYKDGLYHVNWGWGGYYDGYFELDLLEAYPGSAYQYRQDMNIHVCPDDGSSTTSEPLYDFEVDGIYYQKNGSEAIVTSRDFEYNSYSGDVEIPREVTYDGVTYRVTAVNMGAFMGCDELLSVKMPYVETIGAYSFVRCRKLREVSVGKSLKRSETFAFSSTSSIERVNIEDVDAWAAVDFEKVPSNPGYNGARMYCNGQELTDLVITDATHCVSNYSFYYCKSLKSVTIGEGVTSIGDYAFRNCENLEKVTIPNGMERIGYCAFIDCFALSDLEFKGRVGTIGEYAFNTCGIQGDLVFPSTVDTIGYASFAFCEGIQNLVLHDVNVVDTYAFFGSKALQNLFFKGQIGMIKGNVFDGCIAISRVDVSDLASWCRSGFKTVNSNPLSIAKHLYVDGKEVTELVVPPGVEYINNNVFTGCEGLTRVEVGNDVDSIGEQAFFKCLSLTDVTVGDGVKSIGKQAFSTCSSLKHITLGRGLKTLGPKAFNASMVIADITCRALVPPVMDAKSCFSNTVYKKAMVTVPLLTLESYKNAENWNQFVSLKGAVLGVGDVNGDGEVNIADVNTVVKSILKGETLLTYDVNGDGKVNIADVNAIITMILLGD